jgi:transcriptional regulator with XRE-family HTH domain
MKYGERLKIARTHAKLSQAELALRAGVGTQENISKLERKKAEGSEFTVQYAIACGVRPEWLAMEQGEMVDGLYVQDEKLKRALQLLQGLPDYAVDQAVKDIDSLAELVKKASGTHG